MMALLLGVILTASVFYFGPYVGPVVTSFARRVQGIFTFGGPATSTIIVQPAASCDAGVPPVPAVTRSLETFYDGNQVVVFKHVQPYTQVSSLMRGYYPVNDNTLHLQHNWWELISSRSWEMDTLKTIRVLLEMK
jgi:hypothetical protein